MTAPFCSAVCASVVAPFCAVPGEKYYTKSCNIKFCYIERVSWFAAAGPELFTEESPELFVEETSEDGSTTVPLDMTVDELARRALTTTRNVRALQSAGLLLAPEIRGRTAHYDAAHLDRLEAVIRLQSSGFSLASIRALFEALSAGRTLAQVLGQRSRQPRSPVRALRLLSDLPSTVLEEPV